MEDNNLSAQTQVLFDSVNGSRHFHSLEKGTAIVVITNGLAVRIMQILCLQCVLHRIIEILGMIRSHGRKVSRIVVRTINNSSAHCAKCVLQVIRESNLLLGYGIRVTDALLQTMVAELVCCAKVIKIELGSSTHSSLVRFWVLKDVALNIIKILSGIERCSRQEYGLCVFPRVLCLLFQFRLYLIICISCLDEILICFSKFRESHSVGRGKAVQIPRKAL